jgi:hypothetical protein
MKGDKIILETYIKVLSQKVILIPLLFTLLVGIFLYISFGKESKIKDFPVPLLSTYIEDDNPNDYKYSSLGILNSLTLWLNGWKEIDKEGDSTVYKKNDREVVIIKPVGEDAFYINKIN